jgi:hypothetical protein
MRSFKSWILLLAAAAGFVCLPAQAQHVFRPYAGIAWTNYSVKFDNNAFVGYQNKTAKAEYWAPVVGFTWVSPQRIYVDAQYQTSLSSDHDLWKDLTSEKQDFERKSYTVTAGYVHVLQNGIGISGFGGLTGGKSTLKAPGPPFMAWKEDVFTSNGVFFGAGGAFPALGGQFTASLAIALMSGKWTDDTGFEAKADSTVGFSLGGGYTYRITPALGVTADVKIQNYAYNFNPSGSAPDYTVNENIRALGARVSYQF